MVHMCMIRFLNRLKLYIVHAKNDDINEDNTIHYIFQHHLFSLYHNTINLFINM